MMKNSRFLLSTLFICFAIYYSNAQVNLTATAGTPAGTFTTIKDAFDAINAGTHQGTIVISITGNTTETASAVLNASGSGSASYTSISISPSGGAARTISGSIAAPLIDLNGADNVTFDGLNSGGNSLTLDNQSTSNLTNTSTVRYINDASNNTITNCTLLGATGSISYGTVLFSTGTATGNDDNTISNSIISNSGSNFPVNGICSIGTLNFENSGNIINNNQISNYFNAGLLTVGILVGSNNNAWTITNNRLFQTSTRTFTTANTHRGIQVLSGSGYTVDGNIIGYASNTGTGYYNLAGTIATRFIAIELGVGTTIPTSVNSNIVDKIRILTSSGATTTFGVLCGINVTSGNVNIGRSSGNQIGAFDIDSSLIVVSTTTQALIAGINNSSTGTINIENNQIGGFRTVGTTASIAGIVFGINNSAAATSLFISNNIIGSPVMAHNMRAGSLALTTGSSLGAGITLATAPVSYNITGNTIQNITTYGTGTAGYVRGINISTTTTSGTGPYTISNNTIKNLTTNGALTGASSGLVAASGITMGGGSTNAEVFGNEIFNIAAVNATATTNIIAVGMSHGNATSTKIYNNKFYNISNAGVGTTLATPPVIAGVLVRSGTTDINIYNNMISLGGTTNSTIIGIWSNGGSTPNPLTNIYYNTVYIDGAVGSGALFTFGFLRGDLTTTARTQTVDVRNNIFVNNRTGGTGQHFAISNNYGATTPSATGWAANASNYNVLNANASTIGYWTTAKDFASWKTTSAGDQNSLSGIATSFVNTSSGDLHINIATPTLLESGATAIASVIRDIDGQTRPGPGGSVNGGGIFPDFGADEFDGIPLDIAAPIISYSALSFTCDVGNRNLTNVSISDLTGIPTSGGLVPRVYYAKKPAGGSLGTWSSQPGSLSSGTSQSGVWSFTINAADMGGLVLTDSVFYYVIAQDLVGPTPNISSNPAGAVATNVNTVTTPPTTPNKYTINSTLSGNYNVGVGGDFTTMTDAVNAFNSRCLTGPVTFTLTDANYNEASGMTFIPNEYSSSTNTLTIKPGVGVNASINTGAGNTVLRFAGTDYVTIDGSNNGSSSRNLTINYTGTATGTVPMWIGSLGINQGVTNFTLKNCIVQNGTKGTGTTTTTTFGVFIGMANGAANGLDNDNVTIQNNHIRRCSYGIQAIGDGAGTMNNLQVLDNFIGDTLSDANSVARYGMFLGTADGAIIRNNTIANITHTDGANAWGLNISTAFLNSEISNNKIYDINPVTTSGYGGKAMDINTASGSSNLLIKNNFIANVKGDGWSSLTSDAIVGIRIGASTASGGIKIYNNSVNLGTGTFAGNSSGTISAALYIGSTATNIDVVNNILSTNLDNSATSTDKSYAIYSAAANTAFTSINYNDYYVSGAAGVLGYLTSDRTDLAGIQAGFGSNLNSQNIQPIYNSTKDLHLGSVSNLPFDNLGTMLAQVTTDIDGDTRNASTPDIGADEFTFAGCSGMPMAGTIAPASSTKCVGNTQIMTASGLSSGIGISYQWKIGPSGGPYVNVSGGSGATTTSYTTPALTAGTFYYVLETTCANSGLQSTTNEFVLTVNPNPTATINPAGPTLLCAPATQIYTATTDIGDSYKWKKNGTILTGETANTYTATSSGGYQVVVTLTSTGCKDSSAVASLLINDKPTTTTSATPSSICVGENSQLLTGVNTQLIKYGFSSGTGTTLNAMAGATTVVVSGVDDAPMGSTSGTTTPEAAQNIGFTFNFNGVDYTQYSASPDGWIAFGGATTVNQFTNTTTSTTNVPKLYPYWDDLATGTDGAVKTLVIGSAPSRIFIAEWFVTIPRNTSGAANSRFQAWLYEGSNKIEFRYGTMGIPSSGSISGGLTAGGTNFNSLTFSSGTSSTITANDVNTIAPATGTIYTYDPGTYTYLWSPSGNLNDATIKNPLASALTNTTKFYVTVTNTSSTCVNVDSVTVNVSAGPGITTQPQAVNGCLGSNAVFNVVATGAGLTYQWKKDGTDLTNGGNIAGATSNMLTVSSLSAADVGVYTVVVTSTCGSPLTSDGTSNLTVNPNPTAALSPSGTSNICQGQTQVYTATTDIGNSYIWKRNGNVISGASTSTYGATLAGGYKVIVSVAATGCKDSSSVSTLVVNPNPSTVSLTPSSSDVCSETIIPITASGGTIGGTVTVGNGVTLTGATTQPTAFCNRWAQYWCQMVYPASELLSAGLQAGNINSVTFTITTLGDGTNVTDFEIYIGTVAGTTLSAFTTTGLTKVYGPATYNHAIGANTITFDIPYSWDGTSNLLLDIRQNGADALNNAITYYTATTGNTVVTATTSSTSPDITTTSPTPSTSTQRLNTIFSNTAATTKSWSPATGLYTDVAATIPYMGENLSTVYAKPTTTTTYTVTATSGSGCTTSASVNVGVTGDEVMNENNTGTGSLRKAIECTAAGDTVFVSSGSVNLINLLSQLNIDKPLLIIDDNGSPVMLKFDFSSGALMSETNGGFKVGTMGNVTLDNIHIKHVGNDATHPVIKNEGTLTLKNCKVTGETGNTIPPVVQNAAGATINAEGSSEIKSE